LVLSLLVASVAATLTIAHYYQLGVMQTLTSVLVAGGAPPAIYLAWVSYAEAASAQADDLRQARAELGKVEAELVEADHLSLPALWEVTHKRLDLYHQIATGQARTSFRNAQVAMAIGFALLVGFAIAATLARTTAGSVVTGSLGAVAAAFAGYISHTFVRSQENAAIHLRAYFDQPLEFSRYLAAGRLLNVAIDKLSEEQRAVITSELLRAMVTPRPFQDH